VETEVEDVEMPSGDTELSDQPKFDQADNTTETLVVPTPETVAQGDANGCDDLRDQPIAVPSIDITESHELSEIQSFRESTAVVLGNDVAAPTPLAGFADEVASKVSVCIMADYPRLICRISLLRNWQWIFPKMLLRTKTGPNLLGHLRTL
jgi:hypothetical protein